MVVVAGTEVVAVWWWCYGGGGGDGSGNGDGGGSDNGRAADLAAVLETVVTGQWLVVSGQWSVVSGQWSVVAVSGALTEDRGHNNAEFTTMSDGSGRHKARATLHFTVHRIDGHTLNIIHQNIYLFACYHVYLKFIN